MVALATAAHLQTAPSAALAHVGLPATTAEGHLAYDKQATPPSLARILDAQATPKVREISDRDLDQLLISEIEHAARRLGHKNTATDGLDVNLMQRDLAALLRLSWSYLTRGEIQQVFLLGSMRQLLPLDKNGKPDHSEVIFLSSATVGTWLTRYKYQLKPEAMAYAQRLVPQACELPANHPVAARWRVARLQQLCALGPRLAHLPADDADPANLLYLWLGELGALGPFLKSRPAEYWHRLRQQEAYRQGRHHRQSMDREERRAGNTYLRLIRAALPSQGKLADRVRAACRWRVFCQWLITQHAKQTDLSALLWPLAQAAYTPVATQ
ncbi:MAG: hypothetical protein ACRYFK_14450 [Janthinobacterium lividum]